MCLCVCLKLSLSVPVCVLKNVGKPYRRVQGTSPLLVFQTDTQRMLTAFGESQSHLEKRSANG